MAELIKNANVGKWVLDKFLFCTKCDNQGTISVPIPEDMGKYDELYDKFDLHGALSPDKCRERALAECRCDNFYCPDCEKGLQYQSKYNRYEGK